MDAPALDQVVKSLPSGLAGARVALLRCPTLSQDNARVIGLTPIEQPRCLPNQQAAGPNGNVLYLTGTCLSWIGSAVRTIALTDLRTAFRRSTPTAFRPPAQGLRAAATLGPRSREELTQTGLRCGGETHEVGSARCADHRPLNVRPRMRSAQPAGQRPAFTVRRRPQAGR